MNRPQNWRDFDSAMTKAEDDFLAQDGANAGSAKSTPPMNVGGGVRERREQSMTNATRAMPETSMEAAFKQRYQMPPAVVCALKQAGRTAAMRLLALIEGDEFDTLPVMDRLKIIEMTLGHAFGRSESAGAFALAMMRSNSNEMGDSDRSAIVSQLDAIERSAPPPELARARPASSGGVHASRKAGAAGSPSGAGAPVGLAPSPTERRRRLAEIESRSNVVPLNRTDIPIYAGSAS